MKAMDSNRLRKLDNEAFRDCICGHIIFHHYNDAEQSCYFGPMNQRPSEQQCDCVSYRQDNLRWLEKLADGR